MITDRLASLVSLIASSNMQAIALNPGPSLHYLTGLSFHLMERPVMLIITRDGKSAFILPELEAIKLQNSSWKAYYYNDNPNLWGQQFEQAIHDLGISSSTIGIEPNRFRFLEMNILTQANPEIKFVSCASLLSSLRIQKSVDEAANMRKATEIAQLGLQATLPFIQPGTSERAIASELSANLLRAGSDAELPFSPIVSSGPNSANPHATPSERLLQAGDLLVVDWGAAYNGYFSDLTRTFAIGPIDEELQHIHHIVEQANEAGRKAARPNLLAGKVDEAARAVIENAGYGKFFTHRVGHGLGLEAHEEPYMFAESQVSLLPGMTFTVEPGIYLPGRGGVRIEDDMIITKTGAESFSNYRRELITLPLS